MLLDVFQLSLVFKMLHLSDFTHNLFCLEGYDHSVQTVLYHIFHHQLHFLVMSYTCLSMAILTIWVSLLIMKTVKTNVRFIRLNLTMMICSCKITNA